MIGAVCGLKSEATLLDPLVETGILKVAVSGANTQRAERAAGGLIAEGADCLLSFGLCGALSAEIKAGDLVLPDAVCPESDPSQVWLCDPVRLAGLREELPAGLAKRCHGGRLLGSDRIIQTALEKQQLATRFHARAVDMESHAVAKLAARHGLPFLVLRACSDAADQDLPEAALQATQPDGSVKVAAVLGKLSRHPGQLSGLMALAKGSKRAHASLQRAIDFGTAALV